MTARASRLLLFVFLSSFLAAATAAPALAQSTLGRVVGIVRDGSGAVMPGASVVLESRATGAVIETTSQADGAFIFPQVRPGYYTVKIELTGFKPVTYNDVKVDPGQEYSLAAALEIGGLSEAVQVTAGVDLVHTTTPEVTNTVRQEQILELPLNARNPIELIRLQAGVPGMAARNSTAINGGRPTWTQTTQDGINIQDNFIRTNSLDFVPNRPTSDIVGEFTIVTNTQGVDAAGGASQVRMITPSGINELHGSIYEFNRHSKPERQHLVQQPRQAAQAVPQSQPVGRPRRRSDPEGQAVLLRLLRALLAEERSDAEQHDPAERRLPAGRVPLPVANGQHRRPLGQPAAALRAAARSGGAAADLEQDPAGGRRQQPGRR